METHPYSEMTPEQQAFCIADLFFRQKKKVSQIAAELNISRESVYPAIQRLRDLRAIQYLPPLKQTTTEELAKLYHLNKDAITVIDSIDDPDGEHLAAVVADLALRLIKQVAQSREDLVGLGLGPGRGSLEVARHLGTLMRSDPHTPRLRLVTISSACPATCPEYSSTAFLNLFPSSAVAERIGLFAEPIVTADAFKSLKTRPGAKDAFAAKSQIDVVVTSMGDRDDPHDLLRTLMDQAGENVRAMERRKVIGNVMYRPYSEDGPILERGREQRAVTLFELEDFVTMSAARQKHVILIARACGICHKSKATALRPLLSKPNLRVWSELVMDVTTANELTSRAHR